MGYALFQYGEIINKNAASPLSEGRKSFLDNLREKAESGDANAMLIMGNNYKRGNNGLEPNNAEAIKWYKMAIKHGDLDAMRILAVMYKDGEGGVEKDYLKAGELFALSAKNGNGPAQELIDNYSNECHKDRDGSKIYYDIKSCFLAAYSGDPLAMHAVGLSYYDGRFNHVKAFEWTEKSAKAGFYAAQHFLGMFYEKGIGVEQNKAESYAWIGVGIAQNDRDPKAIAKAKQVQKIIFNEMSDVERQQATQKLQLYVQEYIH